MRKPYQNDVLHYHSEVVTSPSDCLTDDAQVSFIFAPFYSFGIGTGFLGMVVMDVTGTLLKCGPDH